MSTPLAVVFARANRNWNNDSPDGCDHDRNTYHYRIVYGNHTLSQGAQAMVFRAVALGGGWENRPMNWRGLSCFKQNERGDDEMARLTEPIPARADKEEIMVKARALIGEGMSVSQTAKQVGVPASTLAGWVSKERKRVAKAQEILDSVDAGKPIEPVEPAISAETMEDDDPSEFHYCKECGEPANIFNGQDWCCLNCFDRTVPFRDDDDVPGPILVEKEFDRKAFVLEIIESVMELSQLRKVPAEITVELIDAVLVVA